MCVGGAQVKSTLRCCMMSCLYKVPAVPLCSPPTSFTCKDWLTEKCTSKIIKKWDVFIRFFMETLPCHKRNQPDVFAIIQPTVMQSASVADTPKWMTLLQWKCKPLPHCAPSQKKRKKSHSRTSSVNTIEERSTEDLLWSAVYLRRRAQTRGIKKCIKVQLWIICHYVNVPNMFFTEAALSHSVCCLFFRHATIEMTKITSKLPLSTTRNGQSRSLTATISIQLPSSVATVTKANWLLKTVSIWKSHCYWIYFDNSMPTMLLLW